MVQEDQDKHRTRSRKQESKSEEPAKITSPISRHSQTRLGQSTSEDSEQLKNVQKRLFQPKPETPSLRSSSKRRVPTPDISTAVVAEKRDENEESHQIEAPLKIDSPKKQPVLDPIVETEKKEEIEVTNDRKLASTPVKDRRDSSGDLGEDENSVTCNIYKFISKKSL